MIDDDLYREHRRKRSAKRRRKMIQRMRRAARAGGRLRRVLRKGRHRAGRHTMDGSDQ